MTTTTGYQLKNLPRRTVEGGLSNTIDGGLREYPGGRFIQISCGGWLCCNEIRADENAEQIAITMAHIIELALDVGFEQGREYVRKALGVKER